MIKIAVNVNLFDILQTFQQAVTQGQHACILIMHLFAGNAIGFAHAHDLVSRQRARTHTTLMTTTMHLWLESDPRLAAHI